MSSNFEQGLLDLVTDATRDRVSLDDLESLARALLGSIEQMKKDKGEDLSKFPFNRLHSDYITLFSFLLTMIEVPFDDLRWSTEIPQGTFTKHYNDYDKGPMLMFEFKDLAHHIQNLERGEVADSRLALLKETLSDTTKTRDLKAYIAEQDGVKMGMGGRRRYRAWRKHPTTHHEMPLYSDGIYQEVRHNLTKNYTVKDFEQTPMPHLRGESSG